MLRVLIKSESRYPVERKQIRRLACQVLRKHGIRDEAEVSVSFVGTRKMRKLNREFLGRDKTTDVLSFPLVSNQEGGFIFVPQSNRGRKEADSQKANSTALQGRGFIFPPDEILRLGDVIICYPQVRKQASKANITVDEEINALVKHGLLHLLGIHHD